VDELDPLPQDATQHRDRLGDERIELERLRVESLPPTEGEQLTGQSRGALRARLDPAQVLGCLAVGFDLSLRQLGVAEHSEQEVVEVVRDARGELADRVDLLRLAEAAPLRRASA